MKACNHPPASRDTISYTLSTTRSLFTLVVTWRRFRQVELADPKIGHTDQGVDLTSARASHLAPSDKPRNRYRSQLSIPNHHPLLHHTPLQQKYLTLKSPQMEFLPLLSQFCGWLYFLLWAISAYPQPLLNYHRKSTEGLAFDYPLLNILGFVSYVRLHSIHFHL